jgi:hypothetical protein
MFQARLAKAHAKLHCNRTRDVSKKAEEAKKEKNKEAVSLPTVCHYFSRFT